jgi:hypothetical protein
VASTLFSESEFGLMLKMSPPCAARLGSRNGPVRLHGWKLESLKLFSSYICDNAMKLD